MSNQATPAQGPHQPGQYQIRLQGHLDPRWTGWFAGLEISHTAEGETLISGPVPDQAALHGLLRKVRDLGLPLISVHRLPDSPPDPPASEQDGRDAA